MHMYLDVKNRKSFYGFRTAVPHAAQKPPKTKARALPRPRTAYFAGFFTPWDPRGPPHGDPMGMPSASRPFYSWLFYPLGPRGPPGIPGDPQGSPGDPSKFL